MSASIAPPPVEPVPDGRPICGLIPLRDLDVWDKHRAALIGCGRLKTHYPSPSSGASGDGAWLCSRCDSPAEKIRQEPEG